ncbi:MAG: hypothetical protein ABI555_02430 [Chloroflexota bacterium]
MTPKMIRFLGGSLLAGALALGTVGFVAAQDPSSEVGPAGMPTGATGAGLMNGATGARMMNGATGAGMMSGAQLQQMASLHDQMQSVHTGETPSR